MPKQKKEPIINETKKNLFFYEILGFILLLIFFFALSKLGTLGFYLFLTVKLIFGDWAFLFTILGIICGMYFLLMHQRLPIGSLRFVGFAIVFLSLDILSHFSMHDYVKQYTSNYLNTSLNLYFDYFKTGNEESMVGGGIVGMLLFYLLFYLLSTPGVVIISLCLMILGICFITKKTIIDFLKIVGKIIKKVIIFMKTRGSKFKGILEKINKEYHEKVRKKLPKNLIKNVDFIINNETTDGDNIAKQIKIVLNKLNVFHYEVSYYVTPHLLVFEIKSLLNIDLYRLEKMLIQTLNCPFLIKINEDDNIIMIEMVNPEVLKIPLSYGKINTSSEKFFLTIDDHNQNIFLNKTNKTVLLFLKNYQILFYYIICLLYQKNLKVVVIDMLHELQLIDCYVDNYHDIEYLDELIVTLEADHDECYYLFINLDIYSEKIGEVCNKIKYLMQLVKNDQCYFMVRINNYYLSEEYFYDAFSYLYTIDVDTLDVLKLFGFYQKEGLEIGKEGLFKNEDMIKRVANVYISDDEISKLNKK